MDATKKKQRNVSTSGSSDSCSLVFLSLGRLQKGRTRITGEARVPLGRIFLRLVGGPGQGKRFESTSRPASTYLGQEGLLEGSAHHLGGDVRVLEVGHTRNAPVRLRGRKTSGVRGRILVRFSGGRRGGSDGSWRWTKGPRYRSARGRSRSRFLTDSTDEPCPAKRLR